MEENEIVENEVIENETTETIVVEDISYNEQLSQIHTDLRLIICFIIFFVLVILLKYTYKFFDMCFKF